MVKLLGFWLSIAYIAHRCHPYIESLPTLWYKRFCCQLGILFLFECAFKISKTHETAQKPCGRQLNANMAGRRYLENGSSTHRHFITKLMLITTCPHNNVCFSFQVHNTKRRGDRGVGRSLSCVHSLTQRHCPELAILFRFHLSTRQNKHGTQRSGF